MRNLAKVVSLWICTFWIGTLSFAGNYIIIIDTSLSMNRKVMDNQRVFDVAVKSLSNSIYQLKKGDIVYIIDFNEMVNIRQPIKIKDDTTKEAIYKIMSGTQPYGRWTFTYKMLEETANLIKSENLSPKDTKVIIISDGIDDPPIKNKKYFVDLEKLSSLFDPHQLIYYISLEKLIKESEKSKTFEVKQQQEKTSIAKKLKEMKNVQVIEVSQTNQIEETFRKTFNINISYLNTLYIVISLVILVFIILAFLVRYIILPSVAKNKSKVSNLICISSTNVKKTVKLNKPKLVISNSKGNIVLKDFRYNGKIIIKATIKGFKVFFTTPSPTNIKSGDIIKKGDIFTISNYTFEID